MDPESGVGKMVPVTFPSKKSAQRYQSKETEFFTISKRDLVDSFASLSEVYIPCCSS